jgi:hypothetical protein
MEVIYEKRQNNGTRTAFDYIYIYIYIIWEVKTQLEE